MSEQDLEFLDYIESSSKAIKSLEEERNVLQTKLAEAKEEKVILEKVASQPTFDAEKLSNALDVLAEKRLIDPEYKEKVASIVEEDPVKILDLITKVANASHQSGRSIAKEYNDSYDADEDGWGQLKNIK